MPSLCPGHPVRRLAGEDHERNAGPDCCRKRRGDLRDARPAGHGGKAGPARRAGPSGCGGDGIVLVPNVDQSRPGSLHCRGPVHVGVSERREAGTRTLAQDSLGEGFVDMRHEGLRTVEGIISSPRAIERAVRVSPAARMFGMPSPGAQVIETSSVPDGCSIVMGCGETSREALRQTVRHGARRQGAGGDALGTGNGHGRMALPRHEVARGYGAALPRCRDEGDLWRHEPGAVAHAHQVPGLQADRLQTVHQGAIRIQFGGSLVSREAKRIGAGHHHRHCDVHACDFDAIHPIAQVARGQERAGRAADRVHEIELDGRGGSGHARDDRVPFVFDRAAGSANDGFNPGTGVDS